MPAPSPRVPKKDDIEQAAMELFARYGFAGTTIKDIAALAGVTEGALYRHYAGKEEMALALFERELLLIRDRLAEAAAGPDSGGRKLRRVVAYLYQSYLDKPWPLLFVILNFQNLQGDRRLDDKTHIYDQIIGFVRELFNENDLAAPTPAKAGRDYEFLATIIAGLVIQPIIFHYHERLSRHPSEYIDEIVESCCRLTGLKM